MSTTRVMVAVWITVAAVGTLGCGQNDAGEDARADAEVAAFCVEHQIAEAQCPFCDPSLVESMGHCNGHGVPEALCSQCNPALVAAFKAVGDWCAGHDRPESQCYICNPQLDPAKNPVLQESSRAPGFEENRPPEGLVLLSPQPLSRSQQPPSVVCSKQNLLVRLSDAEVADHAGLQLASVEARPLTKTLECNAVVAYDGNRYAHLAAQVSGVVATVRKDLGENVEPGDVLATIRSAELGVAKAAYLQASAGVALWERNHAREAGLLERGVSTERDVLEAETRLAESRIALSKGEQELLSLGLSGAQIDKLRRDEDTTAEYLVTAPFAGTVVERRAVIGEVVDPSKALFAIADISHMWALLDVYESDVREIRVGQPVVLRVEELRGESFGGHITWVSSELSPQTRTLQARAEFSNDRGLLRAHMFARANVSVGDRHDVLVVPAAAVQWEGCCNVVFVKKSKSVYEPRKVHLGISTGTVFQVLSGLKLGEEIVTQGSFLLKTEILKGNIGAGCCEVQPGA